MSLISLARPYISKRRRSLTYLSGSRVLGFHDEHSLRSRKFWWPPSWGWGSWIRGCGCCASSFSSSYFSSTGPTSSGPPVVKVNCCVNNLPTVLNVSFNFPPNPACDFTTTLTWDGTNWVSATLVLGNLSCTGCVVTFNCAGSPSSVNGFGLRIACTGGGTGTNRAITLTNQCSLGATCTCNPLSVVFRSALSSFTDCCSSAFPIINATVTL